MKSLLFSLVLASSSLAAQACGGYGDNHDYIAHEWGTFTSIQGTDGVPIAWQSLINGDLPQFVYNRTRTADAKELGVGPLFLGKGAIAATQRIETPVIYFYSTTPQRVDVQVDLPEGTITEWYPQITHFGPAPEPAKSAYIDSQQRSRSFVHWANVQIAPTSVSVNYPKEAGVSHYYAARETDAAIVTVSPPANNFAPANQSNASKPQVEKFLFYRGIANFDSPLNVKAQDRSLTIANQIDAPLTHLFVIDQREGKYAFSYLPRLEGKASKQMDTSIISSRTAITESRDELIKAMRESLTHAGLLEKEAAAMVKTWEDSWFDEHGLRVLYVLPQGWVNSTMPLKLSPAPALTQRVFVGRAEVFTPKLEQQLSDLVSAYTSASPEQKKDLVKTVQSLKLGRFTQAAFSRVISMKNDKEFTTAASQLQAYSLIPARISQPTATVIRDTSVASTP